MDKIPSAIEKSNEEEKLCISELGIVDEAEIWQDISFDDGEFQCTGEKFIDNEVGVKVELDNDVEVEVELDNDVEVGDDAEVGGDAEVGDDVEVGDDAEVCEDSEHVLDWTTVMPTETTKPHDNDFHHDNGEDSDQLHTPPGSEDDEEYERFPSYKVGEEIKFQLGMIFNNKDFVRDAIKEYDMLEKKNVYLNKNDGKRMIVRCIDEYKIYMGIGKKFGNQYWQVVNLYDEHNCHRTTQNRQAKIEWLGKQFIHILRHTLDMKPVGLGLVPIVQGLSEHVEQHLCVKHLYGNWKKKYLSMELKESIWSAARAITIQG
ncbi:hypothetical protein KIW84_061653 [Lathyrus oleraceus]|uniref:Transposase MuDR plant domain-containing protein n=1 Tax=Pisum sativum TaxID=3888 RepID=A0A9D5A4R6_PEA|nr:hypothetical protein KIW84_061653 [Pisum sativum]